MAELKTRARFSPSTRDIRIPCTRSTLPEQRLIRPGANAERVEIEDFKTCQAFPQIYAARGERLLQSCKAALLE